jgi:hypothetical protein
MKKLKRTTPSLIVEGTYILEIDDFDYKIFIDRNYKDTYENRMKRNRDEKSNCRTGAGDRTSDY